MMTTQEQSVDLPTYIRQITPAEFAQRFGCTERMAETYMYLHRRPRRELAARIVAGSPVTWEGIYGSEVQGNRLRRFARRPNRRKSGQE